MNPSINVCYSTTEKPLSRLIRWISRAPVSHALITFRDETLDCVVVMEARGRGYVIVSWDKWCVDNKLLERYSINKPVEDQLKALRVMKDYLGAKYDKVSLFGHLLRMIGSLAHNPLDDPNKLQCSEAVAKFLQELGLKRFEYPEDWRPGDLLKDSREDKEVFVLEESRLLAA